MPEFPRFGKLTKAVDRAYEALEPFRKNRFDALQQYVGPHFGSSGPNVDDMPLNLIELAVTTYVQELAARNPQVNCTSDVQSMAPTAEDLELAINHLMRIIRFEDHLQLAVLDALFGMGIIRVGVASAWRAEVEGVLHAGGQIYADHVAFDDWFHEKARRWEAIKFCGNFWRAPVKDVRTNELFDPEEREKASDKIEDAFSRKQQDASSLAGRDRGIFSDEDYEPLADLVDVWLPRESVIITYAKGGSRPLRVHEWAGPKHGPYHLLRLAPVLPHNIMVAAPGLNWMDLNDLENKLYNKLGEQACRQKTIVAVHGGAEGDAERVFDVPDGHGVRIDSPDGIRELNLGGANANTSAFAEKVRADFSYGAGNLDTLAGLTTGADTATQEQLMASSVSKRMASMQSKVSSFVKRIAWDVGYWMWNDPFIDIPLTKRIQGTDLQIATGWPYQHDLMGNEIDVRHGAEYSDYNIEIEPYSMQETSPGQRLQVIRSVWREDILPALQLMVEQGVTPDFNAYVLMVANYANLPELKELLTITNPMDRGPIREPGHERKGAPKAATTTRRYERVSRSGGPTDRGRRNEAVAQMTGQNMGGILQQGGGR